jgi:hypothetical protein
LAEAAAPKENVRAHVPTAVDTQQHLYMICVVMVEIWCPGQCTKKNSIRRFVRGASSI